MGVSALVERLRPKLPRQFAGDVAWNVASFAIMGVAGLALNYLVAQFYDADALGVFNQVYTVYILLSQVAVGGVHLSVLKYAAAESGQADHILSGALVATLAIGIPVTIAGYFASDLVGAMVDSSGVAHGLRVASLGVLFFALNKVLLALHNGLARLRPFAVFQSVRYVLMIGFLVLLTVARRPGPDLPLLFTLSEGVLLLALIVYTAGHHRFALPTAGSDWVRRHFEFGGRALWGNLLADVNTRVDILLLGLFVSDHLVGVYSFAALIAEGFSQLGVVFRNVVNPHLARYRVERTTEELEAKLRQGVRMTYAYTAPIGALLILAYPVALQLLRVPEYGAAWGVFAILMVGIMVSMGYTAFQMILNQAGYPAQQSLFFSLTFAANIGLNFALIPILGMNGSAIATAISFALSVVWLRWLVKRSLGIRM